MSRSDALSDLYSIRQGQKYVTRKYRSYSWWLGRAIEVSLNMTTGAGGFSIYPSLKVQTILSYGDPQYHEVDNLLLSFSVNVEENFDDNFQSLKNSLSEGRLDPLCAMHNGGDVKPLFPVLCPISISSYTKDPKLNSIRFCPENWCNMPWEGAVTCNAAKFWSFFVPLRQSQAIWII